MAIRFDQIELANSGHTSMPQLQASAATRLRVQSTNGYVDIGSGTSSSWGYLLTDRPSFYIDKPVSFDGNIQGYGGDETARFNSFIDSSNTAYYLDPAGGSVLSTLTMYTTGASETTQINMPRAGYITFYGDNSARHSISSRNSLGNATDDIRINSYGAIYLNLDSNNNNTSGADFMIGRHGDTGTISDWAFKIDGETKNVGIGTITNSDGDLSINAPKLHVQGPTTSGAFNLVARFQGGNDNDNTGAAILINHSNDRGLLLSAGRKNSDREVAYFDLVSSGANITRMFEIGKYGSDYISKFAKPVEVTGNINASGFIASAKVETPQIQNTTPVSILNGSAAQGVSVRHLFAAGTYNTTPGQGDVWATSDMRAPIFYDYDNTNYYLNPAGYSLLNGITMYTAGATDTGSVHLGRGAWITFYGNSDAHHGIGSRDTSGNITDDLRINSYHNVHINLDSNNNNGNSDTVFTIGQHGQGAGTVANTAFSVTGHGIVTVQSNVKAPIFYDSADTAYYVDPASASKLKALKLEPGSGSNVSGDDNVLWIHRENNNDWGIQINADQGTATDYGYEFLGGSSHNYAFSAVAAGSRYFQVGTSLGQHNTSFRAPIFYDSNDTNYYADFKNSDRAIKTYGGVSIGTVGHLGLGDYTHPKVVYPGKEASWDGSGNTTGQVVIDLPGDLSDYDMMYMEIDVYEYGSDAASKIIIGGHNWNSGGNSNTSTTQWYNNGVQVIGSFSKPIRLGRRNDGTSERRCIALGDTTSTWSYGTVHVAKVHGACYYTDSIDWMGDWNVAQTTSSSYFTANPSTNWNANTSITLETNGRFNANFVTAASDMKAPLYYDSNNTAYYVNPAGTSVMNDIYLDDWIYHKGDTDTYFGFSAANQMKFVAGSVERLRIEGDVKVIGTTDFNIQGTSRRLQFTAGTGTVRTTTENDLILQSNSTNGLRVRGSDQATIAYVNMQAPIFYDSDDTGYYVNPAGTSNIATLGVSTVEALLVKATNGVLSQNQRTNYVSHKWVAGSSFPQAAAFGGSFQKNGSSSENVLEYGVTPSGGRGLLWKATNNDTTSNADGGWAKNIADVSDDKSYISICYVKRVGSSTSGSFYHGCHGSHTLNMDGTANTNPYFIATNIGNLTQDVWCVSIGIIQANNDSNTGSWSDIDGVYRLDTGERILDTSTFKMKDGSTSQSHRTYLYYSTDANAQLQWYNPGFYEINGQEPTLNEILNRDKNLKHTGPRFIASDTPDYWGAGNTSTNNSWRMYHDTNDDLIVQVRDSSLGWYTTWKWDSAAITRGNSLYFLDNSNFYVSDVWYSLRKGRITQHLSVGNGTGSQVDTTKAALQVYGNNNTDGTVRIVPHSSKGTAVSHIHYGGTGDWYIRPADNSGKVVISDNTNMSVGVGTSSPSAKLDVEATTGTGYIAEFRNLHQTDGNGVFIKCNAQDSGMVILDTQDGGGNSILKVQPAVVTVGEDFQLRASRSTNTDSVGAAAASFIDHNTGSGNRATIAMEANSYQGAKHIEFYQGTTLNGSISSGYNGTGFNTSSDYRLKENVSDLSDALTKVDLLLPKTFTWKGGDENRIVQGFLAHEAQEVVPESVTGTKDETDENGKAIYQGIDQAKLVPLLTAAIKELKAQNEDLLDRVKALENK